MQPLIGLLLGVTKCNHWGQRDCLFACWTCDLLSRAVKAEALSQTSELFLLQPAENGKWSKFSNSVKKKQLFLTKFVQYDGCWCKREIIENYKKQLSLFSNYVYALSITWQKKYSRPLSKCRIKGRNFECQVTTDVTTATCLLTICYCICNLCNSWWWWLNRKLIM